MDDFRQCSDVRYINLIEREIGEKLAGNMEKLLEKIPKLTET